MHLDAKQKKMLLFGGAALLLLIFVYVRAQGAKPQNAISLPAPQQQASTVDLSPLSGLLSAIAAGISDSQAALAGITQNQVVQSSIDLTSVGAQSWLSCLGPGEGFPDANCIKNHQLGQAGILPAGTHTGQIRKYTGPYNSCRKPDGSFDLQCVGYLITGQPQLNVANVTGTPLPTVTRTPIRR
jgi:hypothetical protein